MNLKLKKKFKGRLDISHEAISGFNLLFLEK